MELVAVEARRTINNEGTDRMLTEDGVVPLNADVEFSAVCERSLRCQIEGNQI